MSEPQRVDNPNHFPETQAQVVLNGPGGKLECLTDGPEPDAEQPAVAVIAHPHPQHGGTLHNKVVTITERALRELGLRTVRFNFRGVGRSEGEYDEGRGELQDLLSVAEWVRRVRPEDELWLAGFSFGAAISARGAMALEPRQLISIAPPVERVDFGSIDVPGCHWLVIQGDEDEVVSAKAVRDWVASAEPSPEMIIMERAGHYFHRRLMDLRGLLKNALDEHLPVPRGTD